MHVESGKPTSADVIDFYDYAPRQSPRGERLARNASRCRASRQMKPVISDDWPLQIPIAEAELDLFEVHFGLILDELLGPRT